MREDLGDEVWVEVRELVGMTVMIPALPFDGGAEAALSGTSERGQEMAEHSRLARGTEPLHPTLGRAHRGGAGARPIAR